MLPLLAAAALTLAIADGPPRSTPTRRSGSPDLALDCVHKEYPGKIAHVLSGDQDVLPPRTLTPAFFGCYDWHSSVHGHWLLARLARTFPNAPFAARARAALARSLTPEHIAAEVRYLDGPGPHLVRAPLRPRLAAAAGRRAADLGRRAGARLVRRAEAARSRGRRPPEKLAAEADATRSASASTTRRRSPSGSCSTGPAPPATRRWTTLLRSRIERFYVKDTACPLDYEPSGQDFLSPCLGEADLMRRVLPPDRYATWLGAFLPQLPRDGSSAWLAPAIVTDPSDPKLAHLDGLNLSRAWMLLGMARGLPASDARIAGLRATAAAHREAGLRAVTGAHYEGGHWLGTFAVYLVTAEAPPAR